MPFIMTRRQRLWLYFRRYVLWFIAGAAALLATNYLSFKIPGYIGRSVEAMNEASRNMGTFELVREQLVGFGVAIIGFALLAMFTRVLSRVFIFNAGRFIEFDVRNELYDKLTRLGPTYYNSTTTGDVTSRVTNDTSYIRLLYAIGFLHIVNTSVAYAIALQKMISIDWRLTLWCLAPFPFLVLILRVIVLRLFAQTKAVQAQMSSLSTKVQENLAGMAVVKSFNLQGYESERFEAENTTYYRKNMTLAIYRGAMQSVMMFVAGVGTAIVLLVGAPQVAQGTMELGHLIEFNGYVVSLAFPTVALGWVFSVWHRGRAGFERVLEVLDRPEALVQTSDPARLPEPTLGVAVGGVRLDDVTFTYPNTSAPTIEHVNVRIEPGSKVAIVGRTGSGKSTLVKLMTRMFDPDSGHVFIDEVDVKTLDLRQMRSQMGVVTQDPFLFSMTVGQNVRFGVDALEQDDTIERDAPTDSLLDPERTGLTQQQRVEEAVEVAGLSSDISGFRDGLETMVGERGITLSGGQKQRATIARAILTDPRLLILDDALASVDTQTEALILDHLDHIMKGRTTVLITHRYNALERMDQIIVMDKGRVVEQGSHAELLENTGGVYTQMVEHQRLREQLES